MRSLTKFQKQLIAVLCLLLAAAAVFAWYALRKNADGGGEAQKPLFPFTEEERQAAKEFRGSAVFAFKAAEGGAPDANIAAYMRLAEGYASLNDAIKIEYGRGESDCALTVDGALYLPDAAKLCLTLKDGTPYATTARAYFNKALFGSELGAPAEALEGYDLDGDRVNKAGLAYLYGPVERENIEFIRVRNEYDTLTFIPVNAAFYLAETDMDLSTATVATLVAAVRAPVAESKLRSPGALAEYGLDSDENAKATVIMRDKDRKVYRLRIGEKLPDGSGYYALCPGKDRVYVLPHSIKNYILPPKEKFVIANYGTKLAGPIEVFHKVDKISLDIGGDIVKAEFMTEAEKKNHPVINYTWKVTEPKRLVSEKYGYTLPDFGNMADLLSCLCNLSSDTILEADADSEALRKYGLDKPYRSYSWLYDGKTRCTVRFSAPDGDGRYRVYSVREDVKSGKTATMGIGLVDKLAFPYAEYGVLDFLETQLYVHHFDELEKIEFSRKGKDYVLDIYKKRVGEEEKPVGARLNGEDRELPDCKNFYRGMLHCALLEEYKGEDEGGSERPGEIFRIRLYTEGLVREFVFGRCSSMKAYCKADGKAEYLMDYEMLEKLVSGADKLIAGEPVKW